MAKHKWTMVRKTDPDVAAKELARIRKEEGTLTPEAVVDAARPEDAPLHEEFEWNDSEAAEKYRRQQARTMIRCLVRLETNTTPPHRVYTHVKQEGAKRAEYMPTVTVATKTALLEDAVARLMAKLYDLQASIREIEALAALTPGGARAAALTLATKTVTAAIKAIEAWKKAA